MNTNPPPNSTFWRRLVYSRAPWIIGLAAAASLAIAGCSTTVPAPATAVSSTTPSASTLGEGFYDPASPPAPEGTITPEDNSWDEAHPPAGYSVVLLTFGDEDETVTLVKAVEEWAAAEDVELETVVPDSTDDLIDGTHEAIEKAPDLIIAVGHSVIDPLAAVTPSNLHQQFLIVGAEIAEPTSNVTSADWTGAGFRGEGLGTPTDHDTTTFTPERADRAIRAGVASVVNNLTGIVVWVS